MYTKYAIDYLKYFTKPKCRNSGYGFFTWHINIYWSLMINVIYAVYFIYSFLILIIKKLKFTNITVKINNNLYNLFIVKIKINYYIFVVTFKTSIKIIINHHTI